MKVMLVLLLGLTAALPENASGDGSTKDTTRVNNYNQPLNFVCPDQQSIGLIIRWKYFCCKGDVPVAYDCQWGRYVNGFDAYLRWEAPTNYYLVGTSSYQDSSKE
ncbi:hypothetical protein FKM82_011610 [Ascaphus truei]